MENSIEEAVKTMEHWIAYEKNNKDKINKADELINIQETILSDYKKVLKENETLKNKLLDTLEGQKVIKEETPQYIKENYISVQKVKDKIEEYKKDGIIKNQTMPDVGEYIKHFEIKALQELLEGRE